MTRTPDEIKKGLEEEIPVHYHIDGEPRLTPRLLMDMQWLHKDALALIQQLEAERDAAVKDISMGSRCIVCRKFFKNGGDCSGGVYCLPLRFEWRGVQKEE